MMLNLNLLPEHERRKIVFEERYRRMKIIGIFIVFLLIAMSAVSWYTKQDIQKKIKRIDDRLAESKEKNKELIARVENFNQQVEKFALVQGGALSYTKLIQMLTEQIPQGIRLNSLALNKSGALNMQGTYTTRDALPILKSNMKEMLIKMAFPIEIYLSKENGNFTLSGIIKEEILAELKNL